MDPCGSQTPATHRKAQRNDQLPQQSQTCSTKAPYRAALGRRFSRRSSWHASFEVSTRLRHCSASLICCLDDGATSKQWEDEWLRSGWVRLLSCTQMLAFRSDCCSYQVYSNRKQSFYASRADRPKPDFSLRSARSKAHLHWSSFTTGNCSFSLGARLDRKSS